MSSCFGVLVVREYGIPVDEWSIWNNENRLSAVSIHFLES